ncbi:MAG TPA: hypothetical protein VFS77_15770, partial [Pyrinomonadaceae bacterium]|nr:hypothetical protein [Pyrinomonadaceae bacterium]
MQRKRLTSLLLVLPALIGLCVVAYKFGPTPRLMGQPQSVEPVAAAAPAKPETRPVENSHLFELFGMHQTAVARGRVAMTPAEYLNSLEALYVQRGYRKLEPPEATAKPKRRSRKKETVPVKFFQRDDAGGFANISATGEDADHGSNEASSEPYTFSTLVVPSAGGGSEWATYRTVVESGKVAQLARLDHDDFPGFDPPDVPRMPGLQRIYAHTSGTASIAIYKSKEMSDVTLLSLYFKEMPRYGWNLDSAATTEANKVVSGVMCFTQGTR